MPAEQKYIYYIAGESVDRIKKLPQTELVAEKGYEILYFTDDIDEFAVRMLGKYKDKEFKSVTSDDLVSSMRRTKKQSGMRNYLRK